MTSTTNAGAPPSTTPGLLSGLAFFLIQRLPQRSHYVNLVTSNGGTVVKLETQADHVIADHVRRDAPPGSLSYTFLDAAVTFSTLPSPTDHPAGPPPGVVREVGSVTLPAKGTRTAFTPEDDRVLWEWVENARIDGASIKGNELYKQLEQAAGRHPFQAWRDRYIKKLMDRPPPAGVRPVAARDSSEEVPEPTFRVEKKVRSVSFAPETTAQTMEVIERVLTSPQAPVPRRQPKPKAAPFTQDDFDMLLANGEDIDRIDEAVANQAWAAWADANPGHSAGAWRAYWERSVRPEFMAQREERKAERRRKRQREEMESEAVAVQALEAMKAPTTTKRKRDDALPTAVVASSSKKQKPDDFGSFMEGEREKRLSSGMKNLGPGNDEDLDIDAPLGAAAGEKDLERLATSDANRAADEQLRRESMEMDDVLDAGDDTEEPITLSTHLIEDGEVEDGLPGNEILDDETPVATQLTAANLASQEASQAEPVIRAQDLPIDKTSKDQSSYAAYLQSLLPTTKPISAIARLQELKTAAVDNESTQAQIDAPLTTTLPVQGMPLSSDHEIGQALEEGLQWPQSPEKARTGTGAAESQSQDAGFETQVSFPSWRAPLLTSQQLVADGAEDTDLEGDLAAALHEDHIPTKGQANQPPDSSFALDFDLPEPEGGYAFSSPPALPPVRQLAQPAHVPTDDADEVAEGEESLLVDERDGLRNSTAPAQEATQSSYTDQDSEVQGENQAPNAKLLSTQAIMNAETQELDLDMVLPPDSQDVHAETDDDLAALERLANEGAPSRDQEEESESMLLELARLANEGAPENGDVEASFSSPPRYPPAPSPPQQRRSPRQPKSTQSKPTQRKPPRRSALPVATKTAALAPPDLDTWITRMTLLHSVPDSLVMTALHAASLRPEHAEYALLELKREGELPEDVAGVWTKEEDKIIEGGNARGLRLAQEKHGWEEVLGRLRWLEEWRAA